MSNPSKMMALPFARDGQRNSIPDDPSNENPASASMREGFPKITMITRSNGGEPPDGMDINGILYTLSLDVVHRQSGNQIQYDGTYAESINGYAKGAVLQSTDPSIFWRSTADNNLTDPDSSSAQNWVRFAYVPTATSTTTGTVKLADTLASNATDTALTANQGQVLNNRINGLFASKTGDNGYIWLGAILQQWGVVNYDSNPGEIQVTVTFATPFPNACVNVVATRIVAFHSSDGDAGINVVSLSKTKAVLSLQKYNATTTGEMRGFYFQAIGY